MIVRLLSSFLALAVLVLLPPAVPAAVSIDGPWFVSMKQDLGGAPGPDITSACHWDVVQAGTSLTASYLCASLSPTGGTYTGTIDPDAGTFEISEPSPFCVDNGGVATLHGTVAPDSSAFTASATCASFATITFESSRCQNGVIDPGETCDEGIDRWDDCCSPTCDLRPAGQPCGADGDDNRCTSALCDGSSGACPAIEINLPAGAPCGNQNGCVYDSCDGNGSCSATTVLDDGLPCQGQCFKGRGICQSGICSAKQLSAGTPCEVDLNSCTIDRCDASGVCTVGACSACCDTSGGGCAPAYDASCEHPTTPRARVALARRNGALSWSWAKGDETDFGTPETSGAAVCVYDGDTPSLIGIAEARTGTCGAKPCWTRTGTGLRYAGAKGDYLGSLKLRLGSAGKASISARAKGVPFFDWSPTQGLATPVRVQLKVADRCWESTFSDPVKNELLLFKARDGSPSGAFLDGVEAGF